MEFTGTYYQCLDCLHIIDYSDSHCPECGSRDGTDLNANEVLMSAESQTEKERNRLIKMLKSHDDLKALINER